MDGCAREHRKEFAMPEQLSRQNQDLTRSLDYSVISSFTLAVAARAHEGLLILLRACQYARATQRDPWDFAVEWESLRAFGLTSTDVRWLSCQNLIEHAVEVTPVGASSRVFERVGAMVIANRTAMVLTEAGVQFVAAWTNQNEKRLPFLRDGKSAEEGTLNHHSIPIWDHNRRELWFGGCLIKRFKVRAPNQERILDAFQEEAWPSCIDNPFPGGLKAAAYEQLHDAIKNLNRHMLCQRLRFHGDGSGLRARWSSWSES
jgi:hypothetical protein